MNAGIGRPVTDLDDFLEPNHEPVLQTAPELPDPPAPARARPPWLTMAAAAVCVAIVVGVWIAPDSGAGNGRLPSPTATAAIPTGVGGFAELYVAAYLTGTGEDLGSFLPAAPSVEAMQVGSHYVARTAAMDVTEIGSGYWSVVVAADVLSLQDGGYVAAGLEYFLVGVVDDGARLVAAALPSRVAAPPARRAAPRSLAVATEAPGDAAVALAGDFVEALLLGGRDIERYVTPDSRIAAVTPPPYTDLLVTAVAAYESGEILATIEAREPGGAIDTLQYVLQLSESEATPLVSGLLAGPPSLVPPDSGS